MTESAKTMSRQARRALHAWVLTMCVGLLLAAQPARADITILLGEPYGKLGAIEPAGHAAIYFDNICVDTPTRLRACRPGEDGAVLARYDKIGGVDWVAMPLVPYLYAVDNAGEVPVYADKATVADLRETYRRQHLMQVAPLDDGHYANWYELAGAAYDRTLYGFQVHTTRADDMQLMAKLNDSPNRTEYQGMFRNCADFVRDVVNVYYPRAIVRNKAADLFVTSPKQLGHGLTLYVKRHPGMTMQTWCIPQVAGTLPRSHKIKGLTEALVTSVRYVVPLTLLSPLFTAAGVTTYLMEGRFTMPHNAPMLPLGDGVGSQSLVAGDAPPLASSPLVDKQLLILAHAPLQP